MKKALPYIIGLLVVGAVGFFLYKKFMRKTMPMAQSNIADLSKAAAASKGKKSGGWRSKIGGFVKSTASTAAGGAAAALNSPAVQQSLMTALSKA